jgi:hypothetical protein
MDEEAYTLTLEYQSLQANYSINLSLSDGMYLDYTMVLVVLIRRQWRYSMN